MSHEKVQIDEGEPQADLDFQIDLAQHEEDNKQPVEQLQNERLSPVVKDNQSTTSTAQSKKDSAQGSAEQAIEQPKKGQLNVCAMISTIIFKGLAIALFFIVESIISHPGWTFILVIIFNSFDFWTVKNLTGRLLIGLRWWSEIKDNGEEVWFFESQEPGYEPAPLHVKVFWGSQIGATLFWSIYFLAELITISFFWALLSICSAILGGINLYGFYKCRGKHQERVRAYFLKTSVKAAVAASKA